MWRKPEEPKVSSSSIAPALSGTSTPRVEPPSAASASSTVSPAASANPAVAALSPAGGILSSSLIIKGEIFGSEDLFVDGEVHGKIQILEGKVTVGPHGRVSADIDAREIVVRGTVQGSLRGRERVEIDSTGDVRGDVAARRVVIEEGAAIQGSIEVERSKEVERSREVERPKEMERLAEVAEARVVRDTVTEAERPVAFEIEALKP
jgi:cytoskeletal protein CcmA (bactofilin family)